MKRYFAVVLAMLLVLSGCGGHQKENAVVPAEMGVTFIDDLGRAVTVHEPKRVAALTGSFADIWCLAGGKDCLVAAPHDTWTSFELGLDETVSDLGGIKEPNLEYLLAAQPDLVLASSNTAEQVALLSTLEEAGLKVAYFKVVDFTDYLNVLRLWTELTGCPDRYETYGAALEQQVEQARIRVDSSKPRVLYVRATGSSCKVKNSNGSVLGEMLKAMDCENIADSEESLLESLSMEAILMADPDFIFVVEQSADADAAKAMLDKSLFSNPAWQTLTAVREGRYYVMDSALYNLKPNARWGEAYEKLAQILYGTH